MNINTNKNWLNTAKEFYNNSVEEKAFIKRQALFMRAYKKLVSRIGLSRNSFVLDLGCGCGEVTGALKDYCRCVLGLDVSILSLKKAKEFYPDFNFLGADMANLPFNGKCFDVITAITSLEFCYDKKQVLSEMKRLLKQDGKGYIEVRNANFFLFKILRLITKRKGLVRNYPAANFRDLTFQKWVSLFQESGFKVKSFHSSIRPWSFGSLDTRSKNLLIKMVYYFFPLRYHYMIGFLLEI